MIGGAAGIGHLLFKNVFVGTFLLIVFQVILCAFSYSLLLSELEKCGVSARAKKAALLFYALFPFFPMMMSTLCKDTLNLPFFLLFLTFYIRLIRTQGDAPASTWIMLVAFAVLSALTKKTSLIVCALSLVLLIIWIGPLKRRLALAGAVISIMVISGAVAPSIIRALVEYEPGGGQEVLSVPLQQVAAVVKDDPKSLGKHEWRVISNNYLMPVEDIPDSYRWWLADGVKSYWQPANANYKEFLLLWAKLLPSHSEAYFASWAGLSAAWFTPIDPYINSSYEPLATVPLSGGILPKMTQSKLEPTSGIELVNGWPQDSSAGSYLDQLSTALLRIPLVGLAFQRAFWASWVPGFALFYIAHEKAHDKGRLFACLIPTLATLLSLTVGPTSLHQEAIRYLLPMVATAPCLLALTLSISSFNNKAAVCA